MPVEICLWNLQNRLVIPARKTKNLLRKILAGERISRPGLINLCFVDDRQIKKHNARFLKRRNATDVLAFNLNKENKRGIILADIMISTQTALRQARIYKTAPEYELLLYAAHGLLHILGYDDKTDRQQKLMRQKESAYVY